METFGRAALVVKKVGGIPPGSGALDVHSSGGSGRIGYGVDRNQDYVHGWRRGARLPTRSKILRQGRSRSFGRGHGGDVWTYNHENETTEAFTGRSRPVFTRLQTEEFRLRSEARGYVDVRGRRFGSLGRVTIMSATRGSWEFDEVCTAVRTSFSGCPTNRWSHGTFGVDELEDRVEDELRDHVNFGGDAELESDIETIVGALGPIEESDAVEVLTTWKRPLRRRSSIEVSEHLCTNTQTARQLSELSEARSCYVGWSYLVLQLSRCWPLQPKLPKEASPSIWRRRWRPSCFLRSGADGDCR